MTLFFCISSKTFPLEALIRQLRSFTIIEVRLRNFGVIIISIKYNETLGALVSNNISSLLGESQEINYHPGFKNNGIVFQLYKRKLKTSRELLRLIV